MPTGDPAAQGCVQRLLLPDRLLTRRGGPREANQDAGHVVQAALERVEERAWWDTAECPSLGLLNNLRILFPAPGSGCVLAQVSPICQSKPSPLTRINSLDYALPTVLALPY